MTAAMPKYLEKHFQATVIELAELCGWRVAHFADSRRQVGPGRFVGDKQAAGFPDLVLVRGKRLIFAELKSETGRVRPSQQDWLSALREVESDAAGRVLVQTWRPSDMANGHIERVLLGRRA